MARPNKKYVELRTSLISKAAAKLGVTDRQQVPAELTSRFFALMDAMTEYALAAEDVKTHMRRQEMALDRVSQLSI